MATVITVHGTNASGPERGSMWWQSGGPLDRHLRELVESDSGPLTIKPFIWTGANSETGRRLAASQLLSVMQTLEAARESYCIVAHSHGGSVAAHALLLAAAGQQPLPHLARCITVGTPYITFAKSRWLFARSKLLEQAAFVAVAAFSLFFLIFLLNGTGAFTSPRESLFWSTLLIAPFLTFYIVLRHFN